MTNLLQKILKSIAYASAGGGILIGGATMNLVDADFTTIAFMVIVSVLFNAVKEYLKTLSK